MLQPSKLLRVSGMALILAVVLVGPYYRGLFFWYEMLPAIAVSALGFGLWSVGRRLGGQPLGLPGGPAGWALLALVGSYVLLSPWAAYFRGNLDWVLRLCAIWFAFVTVRGEAGPGTRRAVSWAVLFGSFTVAVTGLLHYTGYFAQNPDMAAALALVGLSDRLFTVYQYPNTAAAVFMAAVLAGVGICLDGEPKPWRMALAGAMSGVVSLAFFFTLSRGAVVVLPFGLLLLLAGFDWKRIGQGLLLLGALLMAPIAVSMHSVAAYQAKLNWQGAMKWTLISLAVGAAGAAALGLLFRLRPRLQGALAGALLLAVIAGALALRPAGPLVPKAAARLFDMNFKTVNVVLRLHYYRDAARIVTDNPLGAGGWGWDRSYRRYQEYNYFVRETHNHYAQTAVEGGVQGLAALLAAIVLSLWTAFRRRGGDPLRWAMAAGAATIAGHAAIDFDLSFLPVFMTMMILFAAAQEPPAGEEGRFRWLTGAVPAAGVAVAALVLGLGASYDYQSDRAADKGEKTRALELAQLSQKYDPWSSEPMLAEDSPQSLQRAVKWDRHYADAWRQLAIKREVSEDYTGAYEAARVALAQQPALTDHYEAFARLAGFRLSEAMSNGDLDLARDLGKELAALDRQISERKQVADPQQKYWNSKALGWTLPMYLHMGKGLFLTGDYVRAEQYLKLSAKEWTFAAEAEVWLYALYERQGRTADQKPLEKKPWIMWLEANPTYPVLLKWTL